MSSTENVDSDTSAPDPVPPQIPEVTNNDHDATRIDMDASTRSTPKRKYGACKIALFIAFLLAGLFVGLGLGVAIYIGYIGSQDTKTEPNSEFLTDNSTAPPAPLWNKESPIEKEMVSNILDSLNPSVDPCENFYEFTCGNWATVNPRPAESNHWSPFEILDRKGEEILHDALMKPSNKDNDLKTRSAKVLYQSCIIYGPSMQSSSNTTKTAWSSVDLERITKGIPKEVMLEINFAELKKKLVREEISRMPAIHSCLEIVKEMIGQRWIEKLYLTNVFLDKSKIGKISAIMRNIQKSMGELIVNSTIPLTGDKGDEWRVKAESIQNFLLKLKPCIGYFKELLEDNQSFVDATDNYYASVRKNPPNINSTDYLYENLENRPAVCFWDQSAFYASPAYYWVGRSIEIPYPTIQAPFFDHGRPSAMNYGSIGAVIGHEVAHAINIDMYQKANDLGPGPSCLVDHYGEFGDKGGWIIAKGNKTVANIDAIMLDGDGTLEENFADNLGLRAAFDAFFHGLSPRFQKNLVSGLKNFSNEQLFFISYGQSWCTDTSNGVTGNQMLDKQRVHSPHKFRLLGTLQNSKEFATAFNCPMGSPMNPAEKCLLV